MRLFAIATATVMLAIVVPARAEDPGYTLGRVLATFAGAEICGFPLSPEQRHVLAEAGLRLSREAGVSGDDLAQLAEEIRDSLTPEVCERGRDGYASETARLVESLMRSRR